MQEESNLSRARGPIVWMLAVVVAFASVGLVEQRSGRTLIEKAQPPRPQAQAQPTLPPSPDLPPTPAPRPLTVQEQQWARTAWAYFEHEVDPATGLARSVKGFSSATLWDIGSGLNALLAARDLGLLDEAAFDARVERALGSLQRLALYRDALPNKSYDVATLAMTDYKGMPSAEGIGWSAVDIGRVMVPLASLVWAHPRHTAAVARVLARWDLPRLAPEGQLVGMDAASGASARPLQEGRLGYEQYAAQALARVGLDVAAALDGQAHLRLVEVEGIPLCADDRDARRFGAPDMVTSEPWLLMGLEHSWSRMARECSWRLWKAQQNRRRRTGIATAVSEDHVDRAPFFVYGTAWTDGQAWATVDAQGRDAAALRSLSVKAVFGWHALLRNAQTESLVSAVADLQDPQQGWYAGRYEKDGTINRALTANTNAVVLESLAYIARGPALQLRGISEKGRP